MKFSSFWQLPVQPAMKILSKWWHLCFSVWIQSTDNNQKRNTTKLNLYVVFLGRYPMFVWLKQMCKGCVRLCRYTGMWVPKTWKRNHTWQICVTIGSQTHSVRTPQILQIWHSIDNFRCSQWWKFNQNELSFSVWVILTEINPQQSSEVCVCVCFPGFIQSNF